MNQTDPSPKPKSKIKKWISRLVIYALCLAAANAFLTPFNHYPPELLRALRDDAALEALTLDPQGWPSESEHSLHKFDIVDQKTVPGAADREELAAALRASTWGAGTVASCFNPRHAFKIHTSEGVWEVLICFGCGQARIHRPDGTLDGLAIRMQDGRMNEVFRKLGLKLAP